MEIRAEQSGDEAAIHAITETAFAPMPFSNGAEASIIRQLREDRDLALSLVAVDAGDIIGHVAFSPVTIDDRHDGWFGLGPVSVRPDRQKEGVGARLIHTGLATIKARGAAGCALIGNPLYYSRFGFVSDGALAYGGAPPEVVQQLPFGVTKARGVLQFAPAFEAEP